MTSILSILPVQVIFQIISFLDDRKDLLSLAQTCRVLSQVLIPDYTDYVEIHTPPHMIEIWNDLLLERPALCRRVKTLGLIHPMDEPLVVPPKYRTYEFAWKANSGDYWRDNRSLALLCRLLPKLENLTCFRVVFISVLPEDILFDLLEAIKASGCSLEKLEIALYHTRYLGNDKHLDILSPGLTSFIPKISSLTALSLTIKHCSDTETRCIIDALIQTPFLAQLKLCMPVSEGQLSQVLHSLFTLRWPMLKHLTIEQMNDADVSIDIADSYIVDFFTHHTALETLYYEDMLPLGCFTTQSALRSLHYVSRKIGEVVPSLGDVIPTSMARRLVHLSVGGGINSKLGIEKNGFSSLRTCALPSLEADSSFFFISDLVNAAPNLQKCSVNIDKPCGSNISESLRLFGQLRYLTHLFGLLRKIHLAELSEQHFSNVFDNNSSLTYINATSPQGKPCVRIHRQPSLRFEVIAFHISYRTLDLNHPKQWGNFFRGFQHTKSSIIV